MRYLRYMNNTTSQQPSESNIIDLDNGETVRRGIFAQDDGTFLAMTFTKAKVFKTLKGAEKWYARKLGRTA